MSDLVLIDPGLISLINGSFSSNGLPMPFVQEIFLLECHIAGTSHLNLKDLDPNLLVNELLIMKREPQNKFDEHAIMILTKKGEKLGFIPRDKNEVIAHLMDAGKIILGKITDKKWHGTWLQLMIQIYMREL